MGIRPKLVSILLIAALVPLLGGAVWLWTAGQRFYLEREGILYETMASDLARSLEEGLVGSVANLRNWTLLSELRPLLAGLPCHDAQPDDPRVARDVAKTESRWGGLASDDPLVAAILTNAVAARIRAFQRLNPLFAEILVSSRCGCVVAASNKTSDYWQADETWWQRAVAFLDERVWAEGIQYDESAGVYSIDLALPIRRDGALPTDPPLGVLKAVVDASPLLRAASPGVRLERPVQDIVLDDGRILLRMAGPPIMPMIDRLPQGVVRPMASHRTGREVVTLASGERALVGGAALQFSRGIERPVLVSSIAPMHVLVYDTVASILGPAARTVKRVILSGVALVLVFALAAYSIADLRLLRPLAVLRSATRRIASTAQLEDETGRSCKPAFLVSTAEVLDRLRGIRSGDEIHGLARDFTLMAERVLSYHERMQGEIREKTEAIQQDLAVARQFQEALLPASYPEVPAPGSPDPLRLVFRHIYTPALSVGGDFFDVSRLGDHRARILIADVMGHGARSALVTAILHTMLGSGGVDEDPGQVLTGINRQFCGLVSKTRTTMFLTACHLVADTREGTLRFAVAGHPSPLVVRRSGGVAENLVTSENRFPAIGLFESTEYRSASRPLSAGEIYLLYTDGLVEAADSRGEEFGEGRLRTTAAEAVRRGAGSLPEALRESVNGFLGATMPDDDICMLSVEILAGGGPAPRSR